MQKAEKISSCSNGRELLKTLWNSKLNIPIKLRKLLEKVPIAAHLFLSLCMAIKLPQVLHRLSLKFESISLRLNESIGIQKTLVVGISPYNLATRNINRGDEDLFYLSFENIFRGSETEICERQKLYLPYVVEAFKSTRSNCYFLDIGCGRGEFLKLLKEAAIPAKGLEINQLEYENLKSQNIDVELYDANSFLQNLDYNILTGISAFHIIEHMAPEYLRKFLELAHKRIATNGILILETPNSKCSLARSNFYLDLSHIRPYPPELMAFMLEWYGLKDIKVIYSSPCPKNLMVANRPEDNYMDYAILGWKK
jgi:SAM-dependent methyltransferase